MPWLKSLHITAVIVWCGGLLCLPALLAGGMGGLMNRVRISRGAAVSAAAAAEESGPGGDSVARLLFTLLVTPAALVAIGSGSAIFLLYGPHAGWLVAKLGAVSMLVLAHGACGMLVLRAERQPHVEQPVRAALVTALAATAVVATAWLVLAKPAW